MPQASFFDGHCEASAPARPAGSRCPRLRSVSPVRCLIAAAARSWRASDWLSLPPGCVCASCLRVCSGRSPACLLHVCRMRLLEAHWKLRVRACVRGQRYRLAADAASTSCCSFDKRNRRPRYVPHHHCWGGNIFCILNNIISSSCFMSEGQRSLIDAPVLSSFSSSLSFSCSLATSFQSSQQYHRPDLEMTCFVFFLPFNLSSKICVHIFWALIMCP